jgi:hypothetical protein
MFEINTDNNSGLISLSRAAQLTGYHQDYLGQLCRLGKLPAQKVGRNWFTSEDALNNLPNQGEIEMLDPEMSEPEVMEIPTTMATQPNIEQTVLVSQVRGLPIEIRTLPLPTRATNNVQSMLTTLRIQALQDEVAELRALLTRLMNEVKAHTNILQGWELPRSRDLRHSYVSNFDFTLPPRTTVSIEHASTETPQLSFSKERTPRRSYELAHWLAPVTVLIMFTFLWVGLLSGKFFGNDPAAQVSSIYYHPTNNNSQPAVAGAETLPTDSSGELSPVVVQ